MTEPAFAIELAVLTRLRGTAAVTALAPSIFDVVPATATFPYIEIGDSQVIADGADGLERAVEISLDLHAYTRNVGRPTVRKIAGAVVDALAGADLDLGADLALVLIEHRTTRYLVDPDGLTHHGVITFRALIDPASN